uniref:X intrinsic protein n=1 Tax=Hevea brasiliensis TaxID=3981 RepID=A0A0H4CPS5_HEVBR|nr:X intrinsic protein [Hevea brasiliensis]AKN79687.1 X-intrisic protein subfamily member 1;1 [Hevea brasiliensis]
MDLVATQGDNNHQPFSKSVENCDAINDFKGTKSPKTSFLVFIGAHEFFSREMWRAALVELVATACLLFTLTISIISCLESHVPEPKLLVPFAVFIIAFFFLLTTVPLSGGHMSPVFTFIAALKGVITLVRALLYVLAQCIGSIMAYMVIKNVMNNSAVEKYSLGGCMIDGNEGGIASGTALVLEFSCTFVVLFVGVTVAFDKRRFKELGLVMVCVILAATMGLAIFVSITVTGRGGYAGVGLNPARCLGPALLHGGPLWHGHWVFWVGPFLACIIYYCYTLTFGSVDED